MNFDASLEDVIALICLPMFGEANAIKMFSTMPSNKSTYASWNRHFDIRRGMAARLSWKQCYHTGYHGIFSQVAQKGVDLYVFPLAIKLEREETSPPTSLHGFPFLQVR